MIELRKRSHLTHAALLLTLSLGLALGCGSKETSEETREVAQKTTPKPGNNDSPSPRPQVDVGEKQERLPLRIDLTPEEEDKVSALAEGVLDFLESKFAKDTIFFSRYREGFERRIRDSKHFISLMREVYAARRFSPIFFDYSDKVPQLTENGAELRDLLLAVPNHGLSLKDYRTDKLTAAVATIEPLRKEYTDARAGLPDARSRALWTQVESYTTIPDESTLRAWLVEAGYSNDDAPILREFARFYPNLLQTKKHLNQAVQEVDILLLRGFYRWLLDFKYVLRAHPFKVTPELSLSHVKFREQLRDDFQKADPDFASYLRTLSPNNPEYARLQKGLQHYKRLRDEGEIDKINIRWNLKKGQKGDRVKLLCRRLILEGYLAAEHDTARFNKNVLEAVKLYQRKHQLRISGRTDASTRGSINVSMSKRVKQIELGLLRWRESAINIDTPSYYFRVNIPQFELEVWDNNERIRVHRIVVGNRKEETSIERRQRGHFNYTPLLEKKVTTVVINPLWFPPPRLQKELLEDMVREPDFFEKNNYGIKMKDDGSEIIFQKAGPDNALGLVKFLFPNEHHVYLHDTPAKALFERPIRSYSHGCMRLDQPLDLARHVLKRFNAVDEDDIEKILEKAKEHYIKLKTPIPIYVEYNSVGADEEGWVHFYIDIYKYDLAYWENRLPVELAEDLTSAEIKRLRKSADTTGAALDDLEDGGEDEAVPGP
jgi:hypothetical protein